MDFLSIFSLSVHGMLSNEALFVLTYLSRLMVEKLKEPLYMCVDGSMVGLKLRLQGCSPT